MAEAEKKAKLTKNQIAFLEECNLEFSERYTDADLEYKKIYDAGIPPPPIVCPWWATEGRRFNRDRSGNNHYNDNYRNRNDYREENRSRPGSSSWYGGGDSSNRDDRNRRHNTYRDGQRNQQDDNSNQNQRHPQRYRPY